MAQPDDLSRLRHMLEASQKAVAYCGAKSVAEIKANDVLSLAIVHLLEILGEAARCTSESLQTRYPQIPWKNIIATRVRMAHGYFDIDFGIVRSIVADDLPSLIPLLQQIIAKEGVHRSP